MTAPAATSRAAVGMGVIAGASRIIGFVRVLVVAAVLGTTFLGNAFQAANSLSNVLFELLAAGALSAVLVPSFVALLDRHDEDRAEALAGGILAVALLGLGLVALIGVIAAPALAHLLTLGVPAEVAAEQRDLVTFLLRFFVPQVVLYGAGAIATAVLFAQRRFAITAIAPVGNTVVMVLCLALFAAVAGSHPGLDLSSTERWLLVAAGTGGVVAFVGILLVALELTGFRLRPRSPRGDPQVREVLVHSGWGAVLHTGAGLLLGGAIVAGSAVEGGVVAYQVAFVFFLAPYAILAQPVHTAILPELATEAAEGDLDAFRTSVRWALERMGLFVLPVSAVMAALAGPAMRVVSFGETSSEGASLVTAALAALALGLFPYGAFLMLARAYYALGDSRTPGVVSVASAVAGVAVMVVGALTTEGWERMAVLGAGHTVASLCGAAGLFVGLHRRVGGHLWPKVLPAMGAVAGVVGFGAWGLSTVMLGAHPDRITDLVVVIGVGTLATVAVAGALWGFGLTRSLTRRGTRTSVPVEPEVLG